MNKIINKTVGVIIFTILASAIFYNFTLANIITQEGPNKNSTSLNKSSNRNVTKNLKHVDKLKNELQMRFYYDEEGLTLEDRSDATPNILLELKFAALSRKLNRTQRYNILQKRTHIKIGNPLNNVKFVKNRIEIKRKELTEWFSNDPKKGLEHGFILPNKPRGKGLLYLTMNIGLSKASQRANKIVFSTPDGRKLEYSKPIVKDARGRLLPVGLQLIAPETMQVKINDLNAIYPLTIN